MGAFVLEQGLEHFTFRKELGGWGTLRIAQPKAQAQTHTGPTWKSASTAPEGKHQQTHGPQTWGPHRESTGQPSSPAFQSREASNRGDISDQSSSKSGKPSNGRKQKGSPGRVGTQAWVPQPWREPQVPEMKNAPHIQLGGARLPSCPHPLLKR